MGLFRPDERAEELEAALRGERESRDPEVSQLVELAGHLHEGAWPRLSVAARLRARENMHQALSRQGNSRSMWLLWTEVASVCVVTALALGVVTLALPGQTVLGRPTPAAQSTRSAVLGPVTPEATDITPLPAPTLDPMPVPPTEVMRFPTVQKPTATVRPTRTTSPQPTRLAVLTSVAPKTPARSVVVDATPVPGRPGIQAPTPTSAPTEQPAEPIIAPPRESDQQDQSSGEKHGIITPGNDDHEDQEKDGRETKGAEGRR
jgi:hypothetical protein